MRKRSTSISSIFGQIEAIVAAAMAAEEKVTLIPFDQIPPAVQYNEVGTKAHCAVIFTPQAEREFNQRVRDLYA